MANLYSIECQGHPMGKEQTFQQLVFSSKWMENLNVRANPSKTVSGNKSVHLHDLGIENSFKVWYQEHKQ